MLLHIRLKPNYIYYQISGFGRNKPHGFNMFIFKAKPQLVGVLAFSIHQSNSHFKISFYTTNVKHFFTSCMFYNIIKSGRFTTLYFSFFSRFCVCFNPCFCVTLWYADIKIWNDLPRRRQQFLLPFDEERGLDGESGIKLWNTWTV